MKKRIFKISAIVILISLLFTGCTEASKVSYNVSKEAENFNVFRRITVINARSDEIVLELDGFFSIVVDSTDNQLEVTCQTGENTYTKHFVGLNEWTIYTVEDLSGANVDAYHYEIHYLPEGNVVNFEFKESK